MFGVGVGGSYSIGGTAFGDGTGGARTGSESQCSLIKASSPVPDLSKS